MIRLLCMIAVLSAPNSPTRMASEHYLQRYYFLYCVNRYKSSAGPTVLFQNLAERTLYWLVWRMEMQRGRSLMRPSAQTNLDSDAPSLTNVSNNPSELLFIYLFHELVAASGKWQHLTYMCSKYCTNSVTPRAYVRVNSCKLDPRDTSLVAVSF